MKLFTVYLLAVSAWLVLLTTTLPAAPPSLVAVGVYDESTNQANAVDTNASGNAIGSTAPGDYAGFKTAVQSAFANSIGGVIHFDLPNGTSTNVNGETAFHVVYATAGKNFVVNCATSDGSNSQNVSTFSSLTPISGSSGTDSKGLIPTSTVVSSWTLYFGPISNGELGEAVTTVGFTVLSRDSKAQTIRVEVFADGSATPFATDDESMAAGKGLDDTFFSFSAPGGHAITSIRLTFDIGSQIASDDRLGIDDLAFITSPVPHVPQIISVVDYGATPDGVGDDLPGIQGAINAAGTGDMVWIPAGIYTISGSIIPRNGVLLKGAGRDVTIIQYNALTPQPLVKLQTSGTNQNVELSGLTLDGMDGAFSFASSGIVATSASGLYFHDLRIKDFPASSATASVHGIHFSSAVTDSRIENCELINMGINSIWGDAIRCSWGSTQLLIAGNTITNTGRGGILFNDNSTDAVIVGNTVSGSGMAPSGPGLAIEVWNGCDRALIEGNTVDHWLSLNRSSGTAVRANTVSDLSGPVKYIGLEMADGSQDVVFSDNVVNGGAQLGWSLSGNTGPKDNVLFLRNQISHCQSWGVQLQGESTGAAHLYVRDSNFDLTEQTASSQYVYPTGGHGFRVNADVTALALVQCQFRQNAGRGIQWGGSDVKPINQFTLIDCSITDNVYHALTGGTTSSLADLYVSGNTASGNSDNSLPTSVGFTGNAEPTVTLQTPNPAIITAGEPVTFTAVFGDDHDALPTRTLWDLGSGLPATSLTPTITYQRPGIFKVACVVWDSGGRPGYAEANVTVNTHLQSWRQFYFGSSENSGNGADAATPQNDGVSNVIKFATGMAPNVPGVMPGAIATLGNNLAFTYTPSAAAVADGVTFTVEYSDTLAAAVWQTDIVNQGTIGSGGMPVTATVPFGTGTHRFLRLRITIP